MLLEKIKEDILKGPMLVISDPYQRFYIKTDCPKYGIGEVLLQAYDSGEAKIHTHTKKVKFINLKIP